MAGSKERGAALKGRGAEPGFDDLIAGLAEKGLRMTGARAAVLEGICSAPRPVSARDVHALLVRKGSRVGIATVYRTLALLETHGLISRVQSGSQFLYEPILSDPLSHLVCAKCGRIEDVDDPDLERLKRKVFRKSGFHSGNHSVTFYADCHREECDNG